MRPTDSVSNPTLPPYYFIQNCILIVSAMDNWNDAGLDQQYAEARWSTSFLEAKIRGRKEELSVFEGLRMSMDTL